MLTTSVNFGNLFAKLDKLPEQLGSDVLISGTAAMAEVLYNEVKVRAPVSNKVRRVRGKTYVPGALQRAIYRTYAKTRSSALHKFYEIGWNVRKAPHGHLVEFGTVKMAPQPFLRPAMSMAGAAIDAGKERISQKLSAAAWWRNLGR